MKTCKILSELSLSNRLHVKKNTFEIAVKSTKYEGVVQQQKMTKIFKIIT